jgi:uncharacterized protein
VNLYTCPSSDVDLLVTFEPTAAWSLIDHERMEQELTEIVGRRVDLVTGRTWSKAPTGSVVK